MENESNNLEESFNDQANDQNQQPDAMPERSGCLTAFLILMMIGNGLAVLMYLMMGEKIARAAHIPSYAVIIMILFGIVNIICAFMIYNWKKAGVYGIIASGSLTLIINLAIGLGPSSFGGLVGIIILLALVSPGWKHFT